MTNHLGNKLNRIIRDIAYTKGELLSQKSVADKAMTQLTLSANEFKNARSAIRAAEIRLADLQKAIAEEMDVSIDDIRAIRHWPKLPTTSYGKVIRELVTYLQAGGGPMATGEIVAHLVAKFDLPVRTNAERVETLIRGVLSLGILTAADVATGNTAFTVTLEQTPLDAAVSESNARDLATASVPLIEYCERFAKATHIGNDGQCVCRGQGPLPRRRDE